MGPPTHTIGTLCNSRQFADPRSPHMIFADLPATAQYAQDCDIRRSADFTPLSLPCVPQQPSSTLHLASLACLHPALSSRLFPPHSTVPHSTHALSSHGASRILHH
jgi:hypothetical protein